ncbi:hypothetical protein PIB30_106673, partial [Stylosanthes scabra]|nr:hypothetical protein [Stylosanthes scabra]
MEKIRSKIEVKKNLVATKKKSYMLTDIFGIVEDNHEGEVDDNFKSGNKTFPIHTGDDTNEDLEKIRELVRDGNQALYSG